MTPVSESYRAGDVVWAPDPFRDGTRPRLWLVLAADGLPYAGEEYICAALTTSDLPANVRVGDAWLEGRNPRKSSYCSPWVLATIKHRAVADPQGCVTDAFVERIREASTRYLTAD